MGLPIPPFDAGKADDAVGDRRGEAVRRRACVKACTGETASLPGNTPPVGPTAFHCSAPRVTLAGPPTMAGTPVRCCAISYIITSSSQSLLMVLGKEVTPAARDVWKQYAQNSLAHKFTVLDSGSGADAAAERAVVDAFGIAESNVMSLPIKQAVAGRLGHAAAADPSNGIERLEKLHAEKLVPERQALLLASVSKEIGPLVQSARQAVAARFISTIKEMQDLTSTAGKNQNVAQDMLTRLENERKTYQKSVAAFNVTYSDLTAKGQELLATLHDDRIEDILAHDREFIQGAWTTSGMWKSIQGLFGYFTTQVEKILNYAVKLREAVEGIYQQFHENFGLAKLSPPPLTLKKHLDSMHALENNARAILSRPDQYRDLQRFPGQEVLRRPGRGSAPDL